MIRNYNGNVNRTILRDLERLCNINSENNKNMMEAFAKNGEVSFWENTDFFGMPDEFSERHTLKSEEEIRGYLKEDFLKRLSKYLENKDTDDYLLKSLIEFIKESAGVFPDKDEMKKLEQTAEAKRIVGLPSICIESKKEITVKDLLQDLVLEILQLAEEIMESRRRNNPQGISKPADDYPERLRVENNEFKGNILHRKKYDGYGDFRDYSCAIIIKKYFNIDCIHIAYCYDGVPVAFANNHSGQRIDISLTKHLITIHKGIVEMAKQEGIEFESEIDYQKIS